MKLNHLLIPQQKRKISVITDTRLRLHFKQYFLVLLTAFFFVASTIPLASAQWQPRNYLMKTDPEHAKPRYWEDPNVWVYTPEFAKRFAMPEKWVSEDLKGAQAIAYRIVFDRYKTCGWFNDKSSCSYGYECVMDIYSKHDAGLPWEPGSPPMGVRAIKNGKSARFLSPQKRSDHADWDPVRNTYDRKRDILGLAATGLLAGKPYNGHSYSLSRTDDMMMIEYVRNIYPNIDYFSLVRSCTLYKNPENVRLRISNDKEASALDDEVTTVYEILIPESFMLRMSEYMKVNYEGRDLFTKVKKRLK